MAHQGVIVMRSEGKTIPKEFFDKVDAGYKSCVGYAWAENDGTVAYGSDAKPMEFQAIEKVSQAYPQTAIWYFGNNPDGAVQEDDLQPMPIIENDNPEGQPLLVAFLEGEFPGMAKPGSSHAPAYYVVQDILLDKIDSIWKKGGKNLDKLMEDLDSPSFRGEFQKIAGARASMFLLAGNGKINEYIKTNNQRAEFTWGRTSNKLDYVEAVGTPPSTARRGKLSAADLLKGTEQKTDTAVPPTAGIPKAFPDKDWGNKRKEQWYKRHRADGKAPANLDEGIAMSDVVKDSPLLNTFFKPHLDAAKAQKPVTTPPVIPSPMLELIMKEFTPNIKKWDDPSAIPDMEAKFPLAWEKLNTTIEEVAKWKFESFRDLAKGWPQACAVLAWSAFVELRKCHPAFVKKTEDKQQAA